MRGDQANTLVFWKHKNSGVSGGGTMLHTKKEADEFAYLNQNKNSQYTHASTTLTDDQLKLVTNDESIEQFNPFLYDLKPEQRKHGFVSYNEFNYYGRQPASCTLLTLEEYTLFNEPDDSNSKFKNEKLNKYVEKLFASSTLRELAKNCWIIYHF